MTSLTVVLCVVTWTTTLIAAAPTLPESIQEFDQGANQLSKSQVLPDEARGPVKSVTIELAQVPSKADQRSVELDFSSDHTESLGQQSSNEDLTVDDRLPRHKSSSSSKGPRLVSRVSELLDSIIDVKAITRSLPSTVTDNVVSPAIVLMNAIGMEEEAGFKESGTRRFIVPSFVTYPVRQSVITELDQIRQDECYWDAVEDYVDTVCSRLKGYIKQQRAQPTLTDDSTTSASENTTVISNRPRAEPQPLTTTTTSEPIIPTTTIVSSNSDMEITTLVSTTLVPLATTALTSQDPQKEMTSTTEVFSTPQSSERPEPEQKLSMHEAQVTIHFTPEDLAGANVDDVQGTDQHEQLIEFIQTTEQSQSPSTTKPVVGSEISPETTTIFALLPGTSPPEAALDPVVVDKIHPDLIVKKETSVGEDTPVDTAQQLVDTVVGPKYSPVESVKLVDTPTLTHETPSSPATPGTAVSVSPATETNEHVITSTAQPEAPLLHLEQAVQPTIDLLVPVEPVRVVAVLEKSAVVEAAQTTTLLPTQAPTDAPTPVSTRILHSPHVIHPVSSVAPVASDAFAITEPNSSPSGIYGAQGLISSPTSLPGQSIVTLGPVASGIATGSVPTASQSTTVISQIPVSSATTITSFPLGSMATVQPVVPSRPIIVTQQQPEVIVFRPVVQPFLLRTVNLPKQLARDVAAEDVNLKPVQAPLTPVEVISPMETGISGLEVPRHLTEAKIPTVLE